MATIIIDGREIRCRDGINVLQAALEAGFDVPHYCYHPGLSVVASCRLCLMEMKMPDPRTNRPEWSPRLVPSCQTPVRDGMEVRFDSPKVRDNQRSVMEYYLVNHPLDCPVCDKAGECYLQDYSYRFGQATSRVVDPKHKNPKKDIGPRTLLYQDRCVLCSRCVRFTQEISGTFELCLVDRGHRAEIDVFPGRPLDNPLQGNVVDLCPVGCLLDKGFLFKQRVWYLRTAESICRGCSTGCAIRADHHDGRVYRLRPRWNPGVNDWWICDRGRFGWDFIGLPDRIVSPGIRRAGEIDRPEWAALPEVVRLRLEQAVRRHGPASLAAVLSPEMACEEAWLLGTFLRSLAPQAPLAPGPVFVEGGEERFPAGCAAGEEKFVIRPEAHPNRRGVEAVLQGLGGESVGLEEILARVDRGAIRTLWVVGGYPRRDWPPENLQAAAGKLELLVVQDMLPSALTRGAHILLPFCAWLEREGSFMNHAGLLQPFEQAVQPPEPAVPDGQYLWSLAGHTGLYRAAKVRELMAAGMPGFDHLHVPPKEPQHAH
mgnify:CR=1 FL=1